MRSLRLDLGKSSVHSTNESCSSHSFLSHVTPLVETDRILQSCLQDQSVRIEIDSIPGQGCFQSQNVKGFCPDRLHSLQEKGLPDRFNLISRYDNVVPALAGPVMVDYHARTQGLIGNTRQRRNICSQHLPYHVSSLRSLEAQQEKFFA